MATTTRAACRIISGVRFTKGPDGVWRGEAHGRSLWAWNGGLPGDPAWHWGFAPHRLGGGLGEDRNKGTRGSRDDAMREAIAWAEARQAQQAKALAEIEAAKALAAAEAEGAALADAEMQAKGYQAGPAVTAHRVELAEVPAAAAEPEPFAPLASGGGFSIGDRVRRGNGRKVMTITNFRAGWGQNRGQVFAALNGGTLYDVRGLRLAEVQT